MDNSYQGVLLVGGNANNVVLPNKLDALLSVGPAKGFRVQWDNQGSAATMYMNGKRVNVQYSQTVTHEAPFTGDASDYAIGDPVFASGRVCRWTLKAPSEDDPPVGEWTYTTTAMDCICELKPEGQLSEFVGVCVAFVGSDGTYKNEPDEGTNSLLFATHGDFYFNVADASKYKTGDIIMLDYNILTDDTPITGRVLKSIVGKVTGKINRTTVAVLRE